MTASVKVEGPCRRVLSLTIERERIDREVEAELQKLAHKVSVKGFRPGKVPFDMVRKAHGAGVAEDVRQRLMNEVFSEAIREHKLQPVGEPELNPESLQDVAGAPMTFELALEVAPEFELAAVDSLKLTIQLPELSDSMVDDEVEGFRRQASEPEDAPEGAVVGEEDVLGATIVYSIEGTELPPRTDRNVLVQHELIDGMPVPGCKSAFLGKQVGDTVEVDAELPAHFEPADQAGKPALLKVTIDRHRLMVVPELTPELLERAGVKTEDELRQKIREQLEVQRDRMRESQIDQAIEGQLLSMHEFEVPEKLTEKSIERRVHEYAHRLIEEQKLDSEAGHAKAEAERERIAEMTHRGLRVSFVLSRVAREQELGAGREEAEQRIRMMAQMQGQEPDKALAAAYQEGWIQDILVQLTEEKTRGWLREHAEVTVEPMPNPASGPPA